MATPGSENVTTKDIVLGLDTKVDALIVGVAVMNGQLTPALATVTDHEMRIRALESGRSRLAGIWMAVSIAGAAIAGIAGLSFAAISLFFH